MMRVALTLVSVLVVVLPQGRAFWIPPGLHPLRPLNLYTTPHYSRMLPCQMTTPADRNDEFLGEEQQQHLANPTSASTSIPKSFMAAASIWMATTQASWADSPDWGLFEGRTGSLLHPVFMGGLFLYSVYTAILGFQWRRQRTLGDEINQLKKSMPVVVAAEGSAEMSLSPAQQQAAAALEQQIQELQQERKALAEAGPRDRHFAQGALLAFIGTALAIEGPLNTYARAGKLFPGPHLYAGAALVVLWALAAACVPSMQKGNDVARSIHIGANALGMAFFAWQVTTGIPILLKVIEKTQWP